MTICYGKLRKLIHSVATYSNVLIVNKQSKFYYFMAAGLEMSIKVEKNKLTKMYYVLSTFYV